MDELTLRMAGSCGELIQGVVEKEEVLISYPINLYNYLTINHKKGITFDKLPIKMQKMGRNLLARWGVDRKILTPLRFIHQSQIPIGVGMASSTVDLTLICAGLSQYLGYPLTIQQLIEMLVKIEPTDSIIFPQLTLFEQNQGSFFRTLGPYPRMKVLVLGTNHQVDTISFKAGVEEIPRVNQAYQLLKQGLENNNLDLLGKGAMFSAFQWQQVLEKPLLKRLGEISLAAGCYGFNIAHSGAVIGVIYSSERVATYELKDRLLRAGIFEYYPYHWELEVARGGVEILRDGDYISLIDGI